MDEYSISLVYNKIKANLWTRTDNFQEPLIPSNHFTGKGTENSNNYVRIVTANPIFVKCENLHFFCFFRQKAPVLSS